MKVYIIHIYVCGKKFWLKIPFLRFYFFMQSLCETLTYQIKNDHKNTSLKNPNSFSDGNDYYRFMHGFLI